MIPVSSTSTADLRLPRLPLREDFLPDERDIQFYEEHGWFVTPRVLSDEFLDEAAEAVDRFHHGARDRDLPPRTRFVDWTPGDDDVVRVNEHVAYRSNDLRRVVVSPVLGAIAARLARTRQVRLFEDTVIRKAPGSTASGATGWHTDYAYSSNCTSLETLSAWMPLHDVSADRAPLVVLDRSHRWPGNEHLRQFNAQDLAAKIASFEALGHEVTEVSMTLERGQVSFHHSFAVHGSYPNRSTEPRTAFAIHLQDADNRYRDFFNDGHEVHHVMDGVCRPRADGRPDYTDPDVFPVLWPSG